MTSSPIKNHGFWGVLSNRGWDYWGYGKANNKPSQNHQPYEVEYWDILRFLSLGLDTIGFTIGLFFQAPVGCLRMLMDLRHVPWRRSLGHQARAFSLTSSSCVNVIIKPHWGNTWETVWYNYIYYIIIYISKQIYIYIWEISDPTLEWSASQPHAVRPQWWPSVCRQSVSSPEWPPTLHASSSLPVTIYGGIAGWFIVEKPILLIWMI